jgi:outer membrane protein
MKNNIKFILLISLFSVSGINAQKRFTLAESLEMGLRNSKDLKISYSKVVSSESSVDVTNSAFLPQLKFSANYTRLSDVPPFTVSLPIFPYPITLAQTILNNYTFKLSVQQPIFTGFKISSQKSSSQHLKEATEIDFEKDKSDAALQIQTAFWNFYKVLEVKTVIDDNLKTVERHLDDTKNFYSNGLATQNDVLKMEVQLSNTKLMQIDAENNIELARSTFNKSIGVPLDEKTAISTEEIQINDNFGEYKSLVNEAYNNRNEIKSTEKRIEAGKENVIVNKSGYFPQVFVNGNYYMSRPNQRYQPPLDQFKGTWDLGITLSWDIWTWGNTSSQVQIAEQNLLQTQTMREQLKDNIELEVNQNYLALKYAKEKLEVLEKTIEQTDENIKVTTEKYDNQLATSADLIDAENSVISAQTNYESALVDYEIAKVKLEKALGRKIY